MVRVEQLVDIRCYIKKTWIATTYFLPADINLLNFDLVEHDCVILKVKGMLNN